MQIYALQGGGYAKRVDDDLVFIDPPCHGEFKVGDYVPDEWSYVPVGDAPDFIEKQTTTIRDGYHAGVANKSDPNPFVTHSRHYGEWQTGYNIGQAERLSYDQQVSDTEVGDTSNNICVHCKDPWESCCCDGGIGSPFD